jgi:hypothetical protein
MWPKMAHVLERLHQVGNRFSMTLLRQDGNRPDPSDLLQCNVPQYHDRKGLIVVLPQVCHQKGPFPSSPIWVHVLLPGSVYATHRSSFERAKRTVLIDDRHLRITGLKLHMRSGLHDHLYILVSISVLDLL